MLITTLEANNESYYRPDGIRLEGLRNAQGESDREKETERSKDLIVGLKEKTRGPYYDIVRGRTAENEGKNKTESNNNKKRSYCNLFY